MVLQVLRALQDFTFRVARKGLTARGADAEGIQY